MTLFAGKGANRIANGQTKNDMVMTPITAPEKPLFSVDAQCNDLISKYRESSNSTDVGAKGNFTIGKTVPIEDYY